MFEITVKRHHEDKLTLDLDFTTALLTYDELKVFYPKFVSAFPKEEGFKITVNKVQRVQVDDAILKGFLK